MATKRNGSKAVSGGVAGTGKRGPKPKSGSLRDLDTKNAKAVRGGGFCATGKHLDTAQIVVR